jgi:uncharacterized damage-inducible protein DinB
MKTYLIELLRYNDWAFLKLLDSIQQLPNKEEIIKLMGHLIYAQNRWYNRVTKEYDDSSFTWSGSQISLEQLKPAWDESVNKWLQLLENDKEYPLDKDIIFSRPSDSKNMQIKLRDIILQINYHSIGHRAHINRIMREQGVTPPQTDYVLTVLREL